MKVEDHLKYVVIDCRAVNDCDLTGVETLEALVLELEPQGLKLLLTNIKSPLLSAPGVRSEGRSWQHCLPRDRFTLKTVSAMPASGGVVS